MDNELIELIKEHYVTEEKEPFDEKPKSKIVALLKKKIASSQDGIITDMLVEQEYDGGIGKRVDTSWISLYSGSSGNVNNNLNNAENNGGSHNSVRPVISNANGLSGKEKQIRTFGIIAGYKEAADHLVMDNCYGSMDYMYHPIMFCYVQYFELLLKNFMEKNMSQLSKSHNPKALWDLVKNQVQTYLSDSEKYNLLDAIINKLFASHGDSMHFRYLEDLNGSPYIESSAYKINLYSVKILVDIADDIMRSTYDKE